MNHNHNNNGTSSFITPQSCDLYKLPADVITFILTWLNHQDISYVSRLSHEWYTLCEKSFIWKYLCSNSNHTTTTTIQHTSSRQVHCGSNIYDDDDDDEDCVPCLRLFDGTFEWYGGRADWKILYRELLHIRTYSYSILYLAVECSSVDDESQEKENTLVDNNTHFWSSKGTDLQHAVDWLLYEFVQPISIVFRIKLYVYQVVYQHNTPCFAPLSVRFHVGFTTDTFHYTSPIFPCQNTPDVQIFDICPDLIYGRYVKIELIGKYQQQLEDHLWYTCIRYVQVDGIPLGVLTQSADCKTILHVLTRGILLDAMKQNCTLTFTFTETSSSSKPNDIDHIHILLHCFGNDPRIRTYIQQKDRIYLQQRLTDIIDHKSSISCEEIAKKIVGHLNEQHLTQRKERLHILHRLIQHRTDLDVLSYFSVLISNHIVLNDQESIYLAHLQFVKRLGITYSVTQFLFVRAQTQLLLTCSMELGNLLFEQGELYFAYQVYVTACISDKVIMCLICMGNSDVLYRFINKVRFERFVDWQEIATQLYEIHGVGVAIKFALQVLKYHIEVDPQLFIKIFHIDDSAGEELDKVKLLRTIYSSLSPQQQTPKKFDNKNNKNTNTKFCFHHSSSSSSSTVCDMFFGNIVVSLDAIELHVVDAYGENEEEEEEEEEEVYYMDETQ